MAGRPAGGWYAFLPLLPVGTATADRIITDHDKYKKTGGPAEAPVFCVSGAGPHAEGLPFMRFLEGCPSLMPFGEAIQEKILVGVGPAGGLPASVISVPAPSFQRSASADTVGPSPVFQKATSRASYLRARTRSSGDLRRPGPSRSPSRPARKQSPRRRAAARPVKARAWAGWRIAGAS